MYKDALERSKRATRNLRGPYPENRGDEDAISLGFLVRSRIAKVLRLNELQAHPADLCPKCAADTWGRPPLPDTGTGMDFTRRRCSDCDHIRPEPEDEPED